MELTTTSFLIEIPEQVLFDLRELNIPMHLSGYRCLCVAISVFMQDMPSMLIGLKNRKKTIHNPAGRGSSRPIWFAALFIWACVGPNGSGRLDKLYRKYGRSENQPFELQERRTEPEKAPTAANQSNTKKKIWKEEDYRDIPVPPVLRPYALFLRNSASLYIWESDKIKKPVNPNYFRKLYKAELDKIEGVRYLSPHSCRHTYVSQMQALGIDMETIKSIVGHADMNMTRHYLHVQEPIRQAAVQKLSDTFEEKSKKG